MKTQVKTIFVAAIFFTVSVALGPDIRGQHPAPPAATKPIAEKEKTDAAEAAAKTAASTQPAPTPGFWEQEELTGDWGGIRSAWKEKGVELEFKLTGFVQGTASGGVRREAEGNGVFKSNFEFDLGKLAGWDHWHVQIQTQTRFGGPPLGGIGAINPVNTAAIIPGADNTVFSVTAVNVSKLFPIDLQKGELIAVAFGRFNLVDLADEDFFAGGGTERFMNISQIGPLTVLRQVPLITNGASFAYVRGGEPFITFALLDTNDHSVEPGLDPFFADLTFSPGIHFPTKWFGKSGKHSFGAAITTKKYTPFDAIKQVVIPGPPLFPIEPQGGSWSVNYIGRQYIVERGRRDGWGGYTQISFADKATSPITTFAAVGLGGNGLFESRSRDEFGIGYSYTGLSEDLKDNLDLLMIGGRPRGEHGVEMFYNLHITPWLRLSVDLQIIRPTRSIAETAVVPGARLEIVF